MDKHNQLTIKLDEGPIELKIAGRSFHVIMKKEKKDTLKLQRHKIVLHYFE